MRVVHKYPLKFIFGPQILSLPKYSSTLGAGVQAGGIVLWIEQELDAPVLEHRPYYVFTTGEPIDDEGTFLAWVDTVQDDQFVWHIYEGYGNNLIDDPL